MMSINGTVVPGFEPVLDAFRKNFDELLRYRIFLEQRPLSPTTINLRLAAVRRIAYEAADSGLLSPELAAGIRRVKGVRRIGVRVGNWLTADQSKRLLSTSNRNDLRGKRNYAMLAFLARLWAPTRRTSRTHDEVNPIA